jgi:hypothetical protein
MDLNRTRASTEGPQSHATMLEGRCVVATSAFSRPTLDPSG